MAEKRRSEDNVLMNDEKPIPEQPIEAPPLEPQAPDPRRRLRELLAISERERSDAVWDEIIALEIQLAPGNRATSPQADVGRHQEPGRRQDQGRRPQQARRQEPGSGAKPAKRFFKKHKRGPGTPTNR